MRGLKPLLIAVVVSGVGSHALRVRGLKRVGFRRQCKMPSHALRVRGLKPVISARIRTVLVARSTRAWIETLRLNDRAADRASHALRVRGLKLPKRQY